MMKPETAQYCLNDLTLFNYANIGTPQQGEVISRIIENWDSRRYLKPDGRHFHSFEYNTPSNRHLWRITKM